MSRGRRFFAALAYLRQAPIRGKRLFKPPAFYKDKSKKS